MAKQKGNISLRFTETPSGTVASIVYRGPLGKRTMKNLGFCDPGTADGKRICADALDQICSMRKRLDKASGL